MDQGGDADDEVTRAVVRAPRPDRGRARRRGAIVIGVLAALALTAGVVAAIRDESEPTSSAAQVRAEVTVAPTTSAAPETVPQPDGPVAPLTGVRLFQAEAGLIGRPALVVKIDNHPNAMPQRGLDSADVVVELRVEGISRFMAVFHSRDIESVAPVRSARTSDPDLLAMFGRPLFAWSGANDTTVDIVHETPWVHSIDPSVLDSAYSRSSERSAPHNLVLDVRRAFDAAGPDDSPPVPLFGFLAPGQTVAGTPVGGLDVAIGSTVAGYEWNQERGGWLRSTDGRAHTNPAGEQLAPTNVVVLGTEYGASEADERSPEALTLGTGSAWVFTQGRLVEGTWSRAERTQSWQLVDAAGAPILLTPGRTWVELAETGAIPRVRAVEPPPASPAALPAS